VIGRLRRSFRRPQLSPLERELQSDPPWMYPWEIDGQTPPLLNHELPSVHDTRQRMIEPAVRAALEVAGPEATALDLACSEGWFSHRLLDWGAARVLGVDIRETNLRRAELIREHHGIPAERLDFRRADVLQLDPKSLGQFDVVLMLGLIYHLENPVGAVRVAHSLTRSLCVIESQLTRQTKPIEHGWGVTDAIVAAEPSFAGFVEPDADINPIASVAETPIMSLIPNRAAFEQMAEVAGFERVEVLSAEPGMNPQYVGGDRAILLAS
jgi:tRNA (mo5U34)-methyltransferase